MHLLFISYEFPPDTAIGGIATYVQQMALALSSRNIYVDVIAASPNHSNTIDFNPYLKVTWIQCNSCATFRTLSPAVALKVNEKHPVDLIEVPEYGAEGLHLKTVLPHVPLVVKLHTPRYLIKKLNDHYVDQLFFRRLKKIFFGSYNYLDDLEYRALLHADYILSPSTSLRKIVSTDWEIAIDDILLAPNPYFKSFAPSPLSRVVKEPVVLYFGRLETRKGVYALAEAIPAVLKAFPKVKFIFLGKDSAGPYRQKSMKKVISSVIRKYSSAVTFIDHISLEKVPEVIASSSLVVLPSIWENFPNTCLEAMLAGKTVIGSVNGGMSDMLEEVQAECLIDPLNKEDIANKIIYFLRNQERALEIGLANQRKVIDFYSTSLIESLIELYKNIAQRPH